MWLWKSFIELMKTTWVRSGRNSWLTRETSGIHQQILMEYLLYAGLCDSLKPITLQAIETNKWIKSLLYKCKDLSWYPAPKWKLSVAVYICILSAGGRWVEEADGCSAGGRWAEKADGCSAGGRWAEEADGPSAGGRWAEMHGFLKAPYPACPAN